MKSRKQQPKKAAHTHVYRNIRDVFQANVNTSSVYTVSTNGSGQVSGSFALSPLGVFAPTLSGGVYTAASAIDHPHLGWLFGTSQNFGMYRITRCTLIFIGNDGNDVPGQLLVTGFQDVSDVQIPTQAAYQSGNHAKAFNLAQAATGELRMRLPVSPGWKKVTNTTAVPGNTNLPWIGANTQIANINTVDDICFSAWSYLVTGAPPSTNVGSFFVEYDVDFKDPQSNELNF